MGIQDFITGVVSGHLRFIIPLFIFQFILAVLVKKRFIRFLPSVIFGIITLLFLILGIFDSNGFALALAALGFFYFAACFLGSGIGILLGGIRNRRNK